MKSAKINLGDVTIYVEEARKGDPIIFLHGGMGSANSWTYQVAFFAKNYRVITPAQLARITTPTLVMGGEGEELIRLDHAKQIAAAIPNAKLVMLPKVGHFATFKTPKLWNDTVTAFLKK